MPEHGLGLAILLPASAIASSFELSDVLVQSGETFDLYWGLRLDLVGGARGQQVPSSRNVQASVLETPDPSACEAFERGQLREKKLLQIRVPDLAGNC